MPPKRNRIPATCEHCGCTFERHPSRERRFCSRDCWKAWHAGNRETRTCEYCGDTYEVRPSETAASPHMSCGKPECHERRMQDWYASQRERVTVTCGCGCGTVFELVPWSYQRSKRGQHFLNPEHFARANSGENHVHWRGGRSRSYGHGWMKARRLVLARDKVCQRCGITPEELGRALDVHHIVPYRICREHDPANMIALCNVCHSTLERGATVVQLTLHRRPRR